MQLSVDTLLGDDWWCLTAENAINMVNKYHGGNENDIS